MTLVIEKRCSVQLKISREDFRDTPYTRTHSGGLPHTLGGFVLSVPRDATHRRASQATQFRKVCRSKNSNGRPIPLVKWRTIALVNHYIKILYRPPCSRHFPSPSSPGRCYPSFSTLFPFCTRVQAVSSRAHLPILTLYGVCGAIHRTRAFAFMCVPRSCVRTLAPRGRSIK